MEAGQGAVSRLESDALSQPPNWSFRPTVLPGPGFFSMHGQGAAFLLSPCTN